MGWSWYGNGDEWKYLDITNDWSGSSLTEWGNILLNHRNGIRNTSKICSIFNVGNGNQNVIEISPYSQQSVIEKQ